MNKIINKTFFKVDFILTSPLAISSGENVYADKDVIRDSMGTPYIPASSIAGVCRSTLRKMNKSYIDYYFGYVQKATELNNFNSISEASRLNFYDANIATGKNGYVLSVRDSVALDEYKTAKKGAKFDIEVIEPGVTFTTHIECTKYEKDIALDSILTDLKSIFNSDQISFGAKTMRGYGAVKTEAIKQASFDLSSEYGQRKYIDFDMYSYNEWEEIDILKNNTIYNVLKLNLELDGAISIRKYSTRPSQNKNHPEPDYEQLIVNNNTPVIPGTSWAGAFRHRMRDLGLSETEINGLFGWVNKTNALKSAIRFSESELKHAQEKVMTRNAINRFSGGITDGALFTERTWYGGKTDLTILCTRLMTEREKNALAATVTDLHYGYLAIGGLTAIGRGRFRVLSVNNAAVDQNSIYSSVREALDKWT